LIRIGLALLVGMALALLAVAASGEPGVLMIEWLGWRLDTSAAAGSVLIGVLALVAVGFWRLIIWIGGAPQRAARLRAEARRRESYAALARGYLALAAGETDDARRMARRAADAAEDAPVLVGLLNAQAAEVSGDDAAARSAYEALLAHPDAQGSARQGLARLSWRAGDRAAALEQARAGEVSGRGGAWAWRMQFDDRLEAGDWDGALALLGGPRSRRSMTGERADRARAALLTARAMLAYADGVARDALKAAALSPEFAPAAVAAARLQAQAGRLERAEVVLLRSWKTRPHPAIALAYRDLRTGESPAERAERMARLIARNPDHRESRIQAVERALLDGGSAAIDQAIGRLSDEPDTARLLDLKARAAWAMGQVAQARGLAARATEAAPEPDWSDIDTEGRGFHYEPADWARIITAWADEAVLLHPRLERREEPLAERQPDAERRVEASVFEAQAEAPVAWRAPDDPGDWEEGEEAAPAPDDSISPAPPTGRRSRRTPAKR
jgi:HemY protein